MRGSRLWLTATGGGPVLRPGMQATSTTSHCYAMNAGSRWLSCTGKRNAGKLSWSDSSNLSNQFLGRGCGI